MTNCPKPGWVGVGDSPTRCTLLPPRCHVWPVGLPLPWIHGPTVFPGHGECAGGLRGLQVSLTLYGVATGSAQQAAC